MSRKPETVFSASVHKHLPASLYRVKNNNPFAGGIPDFYFSGPKADLWVEYKYIARVPKAGVKADLSVLQLKWLHDRYKEGRNVAVIVGSKDGGFILRDLMWERPLTSLEYTQGILCRKELAAWIQSETGDSHDQVRRGDIRDTGGAAAPGGRHPADLRRPARGSPGASTGAKREPSVGLPGAHVAARRRPAVLRHQE